MLLGFVVNRRLYGRDFQASVARNYSIYLSYNPDDNRNHSGVSSLIPRSNAYLIRDIDGLYPAKSSSNLDGPVKTSTKIGTGVLNSRVGEGEAPKASRTITITVGFDDSKGRSITSLRTELYGHLRPGDVVELTFITTHMEPVSILGRVESHQSNIFSKESLSQIVVVCPEPNFKGSAENVESFVVDQNTYTTVPFAYQGTAPGGFEVEISMPTDYVRNRLSGLYVGVGSKRIPSTSGYHRNSMFTGIKGPFDTLFTSPWNDNSPSIFFSTREGSRNIWHKRTSNTTVRALYRYMANYSEWLYMYYGMEDLWVRLESSGSGGVVNGTLRYNNMYEGI